MSKVIAPLMSLEASKTFNNLLTFQARRSGAVVYMKTSPGDKKAFTPSASQQAQRAAFKTILEQWQALDATHKAYVDRLALAEGYHGTGYHYFEHKKGIVSILFNWSDEYVEWADGDVSWVGA